MTRLYFGTDGIRGTVGQFPITPDFALKLGMAVGAVLVSIAKASPTGTKPTVIIGKDTRVSGYMLESALEAGFSAVGVDVCLVGPMPTPAIAYLTRALRLDAGVVISASHNPYYDNGIKFFDAFGKKFNDELEREIERVLQTNLSCVSSEELGKVKRIDDAKGRYIEFTKSTFPREYDLRGLKIAVDCAHGAAYQIAPAVFHELGAEVVAIGNAPDGRNINKDVGALHTQSLVNIVLESHADFGVALDGDADRLIMVGKGGEVFNGDSILYAIVAGAVGEGSVKGVAGTLMSNLALELGVKELGVPFARAAVGDRYVLEMMVENDWNFGGESSGHVLCADKHSTGDGIIAALQVISAAISLGVGVTELLNRLELFPQKMVNIRLPAGLSSDSKKKIDQMVAEQTELLGEGWRLLVRLSGTEPLLRVMVEGPDMSAVSSVAEQLADRFRAVCAYE